MGYTGRGGKGCKGQGEKKGDAKSQKWLLLKKKLYIRIDQIWAFMEKSVCICGCMWVHTHAFVGIYCTYVYVYVVWRKFSINITSLLQQNMTFHFHTGYVRRGEFSGCPGHKATQQRHRRSQVPRDLCLQLASLLLHVTYSYALLASSWSRVNFLQQEWKGPSLTGFSIETAQIS